MMGREKPPQPALFYHRFNLEQRVRKDHLLRKIDAALDFDFIYGEVEHLYGKNGNVSVPPPVIMKLMLLLVLYNVRSERELMATLPERLDWLWFLGLDLDAEIPNHSILSKARARWGQEVFRTFFEETIVACVAARLVSGKKLFCDSSLVEADASNQSIVDRHSLKRHLNRAYREMERRLDDQNVEAGRDDHDDHRNTPVNDRYVSTTDPEAELVRKSKGGAKIAYQSHRAIDSLHGVITASILGRGNENEAHRLAELLDQHATNTEHVAHTAVADSKYGTNENLIECYDRGVRLHTRPLRDVQQKRTKNNGIFPEDHFRYDLDSDTYICPAGQRLKRRNRREDRAASEYTVHKKICDACELRPQCTRSQTTGRTIKRHFRADAIEQMRQLTQTTESKADFKLRQSFMERSFAQALRYGFKRARYRGLERVGIQDLVIAGVQNLEILVRRGGRIPTAALAAEIHLCEALDASFCFIRVVLKSVSSVLEPLLRRGPITLELSLLRPAV
jgi:transposase